MTFIKIDNVVISTAYIAAVRFEGQNCSGDLSVSLLIALPTQALFQNVSPKNITNNLYQYEWLEFMGDSAQVLQDYFSSFNHVVDLTPQANFRIKA
jgi:hypothetical protein